ncbi:MAG: hypothetical protein KAR54_03075 [Candidatus Pacebacteria bacterium]|nr:hypothetical protein [Candidatus Paceibacterota bacterium]
MELIQKIKIKFDQNIRSIKFIIVSINPAHLFYITYTLILAFWIAPYYLNGRLSVVIVGVIFFIISFLFFIKLFSFLFTPNNLLTIKIQSFNEKPEDALHYLINEAEKWLNDVLKFIKNAESNIDSLKHNKIKIQKIRTKGSNLQHIFSRVSSESIHADREAVEELIGFRCDIEPKIVEEIINDYNSIEKDINDQEVKTKLNKIEARKYRLVNILCHIDKFKEKEKFILDIIDIIRDTSTRRAVVKSADLLQKASGIDELRWLITFINSRIGFDMSELLGLKVEEKDVKWNDKKVVKILGFKDYMSLFNVDQNQAEAWYEHFENIFIINNDSLGVVNDHVLSEAREMVDFDDVLIFLQKFKKTGDDALDNLWLNFNGWHWNELTKHFKGAEPRLAIALTSGYSNTLAFILDKILEKAKINYDIKKIQLLLIKSDPEFGSDQKFGDVELLRAELIGKHPGLNCRIMPIDTIKMRGLPIGKVFVGIESIDITGDIVHPRGNMKVIEDISEYAKTADFYAFGETYKFKDFQKISIDYTKLAFLDHKNINYVVTDHGIHKLNNKRWEVLFGPYLFNWDKIPGNDNKKLIEFLRLNFGINWKNPNIEKIDDDKIIQVSTTESSLSLKLNDERTKAILRINNDKTDELIVSKENEMRYIYVDPENYKWNLNTTNLHCCIDYWKNQSSK